MGFKEIGRKIQLAREERGFTQVDLAQALGITQAALSNYEHGKRRLYLHQIERIASVLGRDLRFFVQEEADGLSVEPGVPAGMTGKLSRLRPEELRMVDEFLDYLLWRRGHESSK